MPLCDKKMNVRGTLRCEEEAGHYGAHSCQVTKAPKRNGKVMRSIIIAGDTIGKSKATGTCVHFLKEAQTKTTAAVVVTGQKAKNLIPSKDEEKELRINQILDIIDATGEVTLEQMLELGELDATDRGLKLLNALKADA